MKKQLLALSLSAIATMSMAQTPAFPGAEGHGRYVTGGRGGKIVHVTNLNDSGTGSFREAVKGSAKKIVVFDVAGVIPLNSDLTIGANTTIEGQTAPYPGITLRYRTLRCANNIIMRFIRSRRGQERDVNDGADAIWDRQKTGIILDHCSFSWSIDEVASFYDNNNFTMQWCTIAESLSNPGHSKGAHGYGGIWGGKLASFHHNMIAHVTNRVQMGKSGTSRKRRLPQLRDVQLSGRMLRRSGRRTDKHCQQLLQSRQLRQRKPGKNNTRHRIHKRQLGQQAS